MTAVAQSTTLMKQASKVEACKSLRMQSAKKKVENKRDQE